MTSSTRPDTEATLFSYDDSDNMTSLTPPDQPAHTFAYTEVDLESQYTPPDEGFAGETTYSYNLDRQPTTELRPGGDSIVRTYDSAGRPRYVTIGRGTYEYGYDPLTGQLATIDDPQGGQLAFSYTGGLLAQTTWSGTVSGSVSFTYDNDLRIASRSVNGGNTVSFGYDGDGLLTSAGALTLVRDPVTGLLASTTLGVVNDSYAYNGFGEVLTYVANVNTDPLFSQSFTRDKLGRITHKTETVEGVTKDYDYRYDLAGRLDQVKTDGVVTSEYAYDANGNRLSKWTPADGFVYGVYDSQDRVLSYGNFVYTWTDNGEMETKVDTVTGDTTTYSYDEMGNLLQVVLPNADVVEYQVDGWNRRVGKKVNGTLVQAFLYESQLRVAAELDGTGALTSVFVYGRDVNMPEYIVRSGTTFRVTKDQVGSPRLLTNSTSGQIAQEMRFDEFGVVSVDTASGLQPFGFAGGLYDVHTKLLRFGARDFDPMPGRWLSPDPEWLSQGAMGLNPYQYAFWNPVRFLDPDGRPVDEASYSDAAVSRGIQMYKRTPEGRAQWKQLEQSPTLFLFRSQAANEAEKDNYSRGGTRDRSRDDPSTSNAAIDAKHKALKDRGTAVGGYTSDPYAGKDADGKDVNRVDISLDPNVNADANPAQLRDPDQPTFGQTVAHEVKAHAVPLGKGQSGRGPASEKAGAEAEKQFRKDLRALPSPEVEERAK